MLDASALFDNNLYLTLYPDVAAAVSAGLFKNGLEHYERFGQFENRIPSALFEPLYYQQRYTDVAEAVAAGETTAFKHFITYGQFEGRDPNILFDTTFYLAFNPDVRRLVAAGVTTAFEHFVKYGQFEGRDPSVIFDTKFYLAKNPDVALAFAKGAIASPIQHYLLFGLAEGRLTSPPEARDNLDAAIDLGSLSGTQTVKDFVGSTNPDDIYRFLLNTSSNISLFLNGLTADADLELIQDLNGNGIIESEDILAISSQLGTAQESISFDGLPAGTYFIRVSQFAGDTNYNLTISLT
ncbi:MAG: PPC domain-containing protein [Oscillatoriaceae bacterium SKW80]|nr:PPC domain-containing protein [Oscillatoriaceae bacterium SKYG93]MCX8121812.1 PPC domain-containing protein [Oscillatoriaceae bacterium SKW80]MDW8454572.1 PPC domain-containing protein [Oscillatoriaceae cyanobacterium SKYGB_i_bin93]HIK27386.1 PPC domain-containing protein [Oscillatoriaceae cyanobacterium M7585_C2015_266]